VGRLGGDEFVVVLPDLNDGVQSQVVADKILAAFRGPYSLEGQQVSTTASIGVSVFPSDGDNAHTLLRNADAAMYQAKAAGRNTFRFFTPQIDRQEVKRTDIEFLLRHALERKEMFLVYHPLFDLRSGKLVGAEALLRWNHPELGLVSPDYFIPVAENDGLIGRLGEFVLHTACQQSRTWRQRAGTPMRVAVNVSSRQFQGNKLLEVVSAALRDNQLTPEQLELEITEGVLVDDAPHTIGVLDALSKMGIHFSVDDFGTGYSSISYLRRFPINTLKIDRSFVRDITTNPADAALAIAMVGMAHSLGMEVVAEGVETEEQLSFLRFHGCDLAQGYYYTRPMVAEEFAKYIHDRVGDRQPATRPSTLLT
jgi:predicted signal transduction protein with EAL and GGDEF domain